MSKQALSDRILSLRHSLSGDDLAWSVCKATTEEERAPKVKHLSYLEFCTNMPNVSIPKLAHLLYERSLNQNIVVVFKTLITVHHLMCHGNEVLIRYFASWRNKFHTERFLRKTRSHDCGMFMCLATYACYVNEKAVSYRKLAIDFCKTTREHRNDELRNMDFEQLLSTLSVIHKQLFILLQFYCSRSMITNVVIAAAFKLLYSDLIKLFACYNDGIIRLLETFSRLNRQQLQKVLIVYRKFVSEMDKVSEFLKLAKEIGIENNCSTDLTKAPSGILIALENHVNSLDRRKSGSSKNSELLSLCSDRFSITTSEIYSHVDVGRETLRCSPQSSDMTWNEPFNDYNSSAAHFCNTNPFIDDMIHFQQKPENRHGADLQGNQIIVNDSHLWNSTNPFLCDVENLVSNDTMRTNIDPGFTTQHNNSTVPAVSSDNFRISEQTSSSFTSDLQSSIAELMSNLSSGALQRFGPKRNANIIC